MSDFIPWQHAGIVRVLNPLVAYPHRDGVAWIETHAEIAEDRLERDGVSAELVAYLEGLRR